MVAAGADELLCDRARNGGVLEQGVIDSGIHEGRNDDRPHADPEAAPIVYEQPLNERMRTFLRLEFLYTQATYHSESPNP